jgi:prophage tail gpP-like protein
VELPGNALSASFVANGAARYSEYRCKGQRVGDDHDFGSTIAEVEGTAEDDEPPLRRVLLLQAEGAADTKRCRERAAWEAAQRAGRSTELAVTVAGWRQRDGQLWTPNQLVRCTADILGVDAELLLVACTYSLDDGGGELCEMQLAPAAGYELLAPAERAGKKKAAVGKGLAVWEELSL